MNPDDIIKTIANLASNNSAYASLQDVYKSTDRASRSVTYTTDGKVLYFYGALTTGLGMDRVPGDRYPVHGFVTMAETPTVSVVTGKKSPINFLPVIREWVLERVEKGGVERQRVTPEFRAELMDTLKGIRNQQRYSPSLGRRVTFGKYVAARCVAPMLARATHWALDERNSGALYLGREDKELLVVSLRSDRPLPERVLRLAR